MKREIIITDDGSTSIHLPEWNENYHSKHGAIQEAKHVFIKNGLELFANQSMSILEIGFGTGLNALITALEAQELGLTISYDGVEAYPVELLELQQMNFGTQFENPDVDVLFQRIHACPWNERFLFTAHFDLIKRQQFFDTIDDVDAFDLIYFDAFGYRVQPENWSTEIFQKMYNALKSGGILVTYAARGVVKRSMQQVGFVVEKLAGPPGKREMFRARKA